MVERGDHPLWVALQTPPTWSETPCKVMADEVSDAKRPMAPDCTCSTLVAIHHQPHEEDTENDIDVDTREMRKAVSCQSLSDLRAAGWTCTRRERLVRERKLAFWHYVSPTGKTLKIWDHDSVLEHDTDDSIMSKDTMKLKSPESVIAADHAGAGKNDETSEEGDDEVLSYLCDVLREEERKEDEERKQMVLRKFPDLDWENLDRDGKVCMYYYTMDLYGWPVADATDAKDDDYDKAGAGHDDITVASLS